MYFHLLFPRARVICYEPAAENFAYLQRNLGGEANVELFNCALSNSSAPRPLYGFG